MIKSMTGFGKATSDTGNKKITVEIRSLNSKQLDLTVKLPAAYKEKELGLRSEISRLLERGKIELWVFVESPDEESNYQINQGLALNYYRQLKDLAEKLGEPAEANHLDLLLKMPEVFRQERQAPDEKEWKKILQTIRKAAKELIVFRTDEGGVLAKDLEQRIISITGLLVSIEKYEDSRIDKIKSRIRKSLEAINENDKLDQNRFEQELIYYLEKLDINEEKVRLKAHCDYFLKIMKAKASQGKKLGFISQEIGREINTISSKANNVDIQKIAVQMKDELEKVKEQMLNIL